MNKLTEILETLHDEYSIGNELQDYGFFKEASESIKKMIREKIWGEKRVYDIAESASRQDIEDIIKRTEKKLGGNIFKIDGKYYISLSDLDNFIDTL